MMKRYKLGIQDYVSERYKHPKGNWVKYSDLPQWESTKENPPDPMTFVNWHDSGNVYPGWYDPSNEKYPYQFIDKDFGVNGFRKDYPPESWQSLPNPPDAPFLEKAEDKTI